MCRTCCRDIANRIWGLITIAHLAATARRLAVLRLFFIRLRRGAGINTMRSRLPRFKLFNIGCFSFKCPVFIRRRISWSRLLRLTVKSVITLSRFGCRLGADSCLIGCDSSFAGITALGGATLRSRFVETVRRTGALVALTSPLSFFYWV